MAKKVNKKKRGKSTDHLNSIDEVNKNISKAMKKVNKSISASLKSNNSKRKG